MHGDGVTLDGFYYFVLDYDDYGRATGSPPQSHISILFIAHALRYHDILNNLYPTFPVMHITEDIAGKSFYIGVPLSVNWILLHLFNVLSKILPYGIHQ